MHRYKALLQALVILAGSCTPGFKGFSYRNDTLLTIQSPLPGERFVTNETVSLKVSVRDRHIDPSQIIWTSSISGALGHGKEIQVSQLPPGAHDIKVSVDGETQSISIREFKDLWDLYRATPSPAELDRLRKDFSVNWVDGTQPDEKWGPYDPPIFNQASPLPAKVVVLANLDILRHQAFSEPLPSGDGLKVYDHLRKYVKEIDLGLDCGNSSGGGGRVSLNRWQSMWSLAKHDCKSTTSDGSQFVSYFAPLYLLMHEARHSEPGDKHHTSCFGFDNMDQSLDQGSGHAWATLYAMWVYKYGLYDPPIIKQQAKNQAYGLLSRLCSKPASSNPKVQAIITELLGDDQPDNSGVASTQLPAPSLLSPEEGARLDQFPRNTTLRWSAVPRAAAYVVEWDYSQGDTWWSQINIDYPSPRPKEGGGWWAELHKSGRARYFTTETSFTFGFVGAQRGRWRVWAVDANNNPGDRSKWREFLYVR